MTLLLARIWTLRVPFGIGVCTLLLLSCDIRRPNEFLPLEDGETCVSDVECSGGFACSRAGVCAAVGSPGTVGNGQPCTEDANCRQNLACRWPGVCRPPSAAAAGSRCISSANCEAGLVCNRQNTCRALGEPGTLPAGAECDTSSACASGLICNREQQCEDADSPPWSGISCESDEADAQPVVRFDIPRGATTTDLLSLPYPNNIRLNRQQLNLEGFPGAAARPGPGDLLGRYIPAMRRDQSGFGLNETIYFRFRGAVDYGSLRFGGENSNFTFVNLNAGSPAYGSTPRSEYYATAGRTPYICPNWLGIRPSEGSPLGAGEVYGVVLMRGLQTVDGIEFEPSEDFKARLEPIYPNHPALEDAWRAYAPLRAWLDEEGINKNDVIGATVFTTGPVRVRASNTRSVVREAPAPMIAQIALCEDGTVSPCQAGGDRRCGAVQPGYREIHARIELPDLLEGNAPFEEYGGGASFRRSRPQIQGQETVCVALTIPKGRPPSGGWPTALFAHDLGGHFRTGIVSGLADTVTEAGWALLSYDGVLHGPRYGLGSQPSLEQVAGRLMDITRPGLLRDQAVQGAADLHALTRAIEEGLFVHLPMNRSYPATRSRLLDTGWGESSTPFAAYEPGIKAAIIGGAGAGMTDMLRLRTAPYNIADDVAVALSEFELTRSSASMHPVLQVLQSWLDPRDPQNYGTLLRRPPEDGQAKHVFYLYGVGEEGSDVPRENRNALAISSG